jgi:Zn finger protein HypA/HybF involved in hydrogenase expression
LKKKISWVCFSCGMEHGKARGVASTFHFGKCDICGEEKKAVTQGRDYNIYEIEVKNEAD